MIIENIYGKMQTVTKKWGGKEQGSMRKKPT